MVSASELYQDFYSYLLRCCSALSGPTAVQASLCTLVIYLLSVIKMRLVISTK